MIPVQRSSPILLERTNRGALIGTTGSGKSTLARQLIRFCPARPCLIVDGKHDFDPGDYEEWFATDSVDGARYLWQRGRNAIYRPPPTQIEDYSLLFELAFWAAVPLIYIDEASLCVKNTQTYPTYMRAIWQQGRSRGITALAGTQRPAGVPVFLFSESEQKWSFELLTFDDRQRVSEWIGDQIMETGWPDDHAFWYRNKRDRRPRYCRLNLLEGN